MNTPGDSLLNPDRKEDGRFSRFGDLSICLSLAGLGAGVDLSLDDSSVEHSLVAGKAGEKKENIATGLVMGEDGDRLVRKLVGRRI